MKVARFVTYGRGAWDFRIQNVLSIQTTEPNQISVYPQPSDGLLNVSTDFRHGFEYSVFSLNGQLVENGITSSSSTQINLSVNKNGVYLLRLKSGQTEVLRKIIIAH